MVIPALGAVPWKVILTSAPMVLDSARWLLGVVTEKKDRTRSQGAEVETEPDLSRAVDDLRSRVESLRADSQAQAELIARLAEQAEALSRGVRATSTRLSVLLWVSAAAVAIASGALALTLLR